MVTNIDTNTSTELAANRTGYYEASLLLPSNYRVSAETSGFKRSIRNIQRDFRFKERITFQLRMDAINTLNRAQMSGPSTSPTSTDFGRITSQSSATNRWIQIQGRIRF